MRVRAGGVGGLGDLLQHFYTSRGGHKSGKVAKWRSFIIDTQAVDLPILPTMTSGGERRDARGRGLNLVLLPHHFLTHFTFSVIDVNSNENSSLIPVLSAVSGLKINPKKNILTS